jgi:transposase
MMEVVFIDEVGFSFLADTGTTWAPVAHPPILRRISQRRALSTMVFLTLSKKLYRCHFSHAIRGVDVVEGLRHLNRYVSGPKFIIWDRLGAHKSEEVQTYLTEHREIEIEWLPAYAPELNPEEQCNDNLKQHMLNAAPRTIEEMRHNVDRQIVRLRHRPNLIHNFFVHAGLLVK